MKRREILLGAASLASAGPAVARKINRSPADLQEVLDGWDTDEHLDLKGVVVRRGGRVVAQRYYNGGGPEVLHDVRSVGKSVTSLLVGIAIDEGRIRNVADLVERYLPQTKDTAVGSATIADILTMRSGLAADDDVIASPGNEDRLTSAAYPDAFLASIPRDCQPGSTYVYNSLAAYVAGLVVAASVGEREAEFADRELFRPLGITEFTWARDSLGRTKGQGNLFISADSLSRIGQTTLDLGACPGNALLYH